MFFYFLPLQTAYGSLKRNLTTEEGVLQREILVELSRTLFLPIMSYIEQQICGRDKRRSSRQSWCVFEGWGKGICSFFWFVFTQVQFWTHRMRIFKPERIATNLSKRNDVRPSVKMRCMHHVWELPLTVSPVDDSRSSIDGLFCRDLDSCAGDWGLVGFSDSNPMESVSLSHGNVLQKGSSAVDTLLSGLVSAEKRKTYDFKHYNRENKPRCV